MRQTLGAPLVQDRAGLADGGVNGVQRRAFLRQPRRAHLQQAGQRIGIGDIVHAIGILAVVVQPVGQGGGRGRAGAVELRHALDQASQCGARRRFALGRVLRHQLARRERFARAGDGGVQLALDVACRAASPQGGARRAFLCEFGIDAFEVERTARTSGVDLGDTRGQRRRFHVQCGNRGGGVGQCVGLLTPRGGFVRARPAPAGRIAPPCRLPAIAMHIGQWPVEFGQQRGQLRVGGLPAQRVGLERGLRARPPLRARHPLPGAGAPDRTGRRRHRAVRRRGRQRRRATVALAGPTRRPRRAAHCAGRRTRRRVRQRPAVRRQPAGRRARPARGW